MLHIEEIEEEKGKQEWGRLKEEWIHENNKKKKRERDKAMKMCTVMLASGGLFFFRIGVRHVGKKDMFSHGYFFPYRNTVRFRNQ